jgi:hypothetical protein
MARTDRPAGRNQNGAVAQLGERMNGIHEVRGSIPLGSTNSKNPLHHQGSLVPKGTRFLHGLRYKLDLFGSKFGIHRQRKNLACGFLRDRQRDIAIPKL